MSALNARIAETISAFRVSPAFLAARVALVKSRAVARIPSVRLGDFVGMGLEEVCDFCATR